MTRATAARRALVKIARGITPAFVATVCLIVGLGLFVAGVYWLTSIGWALLAAALALLAVSFVLIRGLLRVG